VVVVIEALLAETRRGKQRILLGMHADADVVRAAAQPVIIAPRAAVAAAVGAVRHAEGGPVVSRAQDPRIAGDHRSHPAPEAVRAGASGERDEQKVLILAGPVWRRGAHISMVAEIGGFMTPRSSG